MRPPGHKPNAAELRQATPYRSVAKGAVAVIFGLSPQAVDKWSGCPRNADRTYDLVKVVPWRLEALQKEAISRTVGEPKKQSTSLERTRKFRAELTKLDLLERRKMLVSTEEVQKKWATLLSRFKARLSHLGIRVRGKLAHQQLPHEIIHAVQVSVDKEIDSALTELANHYEAEAEEEED